MQLLDLSHADPRRNLACDEALLNWCDTHQRPVMRFWESQVPFVVLGYANKLAKETDPVACERLGIPILRRCSGGGAVVQGPGCLSYALALPLEWAGELRTIAGANAFIMGRHRETLDLLLQGNVSVQGHTDLVWNEKKFSGNSQRRGRDALLFHGTFLLDFDLSLVEKVLQMPLLQPDYRQQRPHGEFVTNIPLGIEALKDALCQAWKVNGRFTADLDQEMTRLLAEKYGIPEWHGRF